MRKNILLAMVPLLLLCTVPVFAADTVIWSENFNSYDTGFAPPAPWADWTPGTAPAPTTIVGGGNTGNCMQMTPAWAEPVTWFANAFDVSRRVVDVTWYIRGDLSSQSTGAPWAGRWSTYFGTMDGPYGTPASMAQYGSNIGEVGINGDWTDPVTGGTPVSWNGVWYYDAPVMKDSVTWNKVTISSIGRVVTAGGVLGESTLTISYTDPNGLFHTWTSPSAPFHLGADKLNGLDTYADATGDATKAWYMDDISIVQKEELAAPLDPPPTPNKGWYPSTKVFQGGIISDSSRYAYITSGSGTDGELYRYDSATGAFDKMTNRPTDWSTTDPNGIVTNHNDQHEAHGLGFMPGTYDPNTQKAYQVGTIVDFAGDNFPTGCNAYVYDVATDTWVSRTLARNADSYESTQCQTAIGNYQIGATTPGQGGTTVYDKTTGTFIAGQAAGTTPTPDYGWAWGSAMAAAPNADPNGSAQAVYLIGTNNASTGKGNLIRGDVDRFAADPNRLTPLWDPAGTLADLPVAAPTGNVENGLCYVSPKFSALYVIHQVWGLAGLYEVRVQGGGLFAVLEGSDAIYKYDIASNSWSTLTQVLPFLYGGGDDISSSLLLTGDTNADGVVDVNDLNNVYNNLGTAGPLGDTNGDLVVDVIDLNNVYNWLGTTNDWYGVAGAAEIPEPATMVLLALGGLAALRRRR